MTLYIYVMNVKRKLVKRKDICVVKGTFVISVLAKICNITS